MRNDKQNNTAIPDSIIDRYEILTPFNADANVFLVRDRLTKELLVEKIISAYNPSLYRQLKDLSLKGIPQIYRIETINGETILIEEYIHGLNLMQVILNKGPLAESSVLSYMVRLCDILEQFHKMSPQIIHRDIKPGNIILDNNSDIYLIDFNISREYNPESTLDTVALVSHHFSAPESYGFGQTDPRSDIYSIGATMHYLLTGGYIKETTYNGPLKDIIDKCTMMDPDRRYQSVNELKAAFDNYLGLVPAPDQSSQKSFLPPGFRSGRPFKMVLSTICYIFICFFCFSIDLKSQLKAPFSFVEIWLERICFLAFFIISVLLIFNYRGWLDKLPGIGKKNFKILKAAVSIYILFSILFALIVIFTMIMAAF